MKIRREWGGTDAARPDFGMLKEGLRVAQGTTPTAVANGKSRAARAHSEALIRMFAGATSPLELGRGSFHPGLPGSDDEAEV